MRREDLEQRRHKSLWRFGLKSYADASRNDKPILRKSNDCPVCRERSFLFRSLCAVPTVFFLVTRMWKGCGGHDFIPDRAWKMLRENFLVYVRFELFLNNFWSSSTILLCFVFIRFLFEQSELNCFWIISEVLAPFYYALFSFAFCLNNLTQVRSVYL